MRDGINPVIDRMRSLPIPIVVAVNGAAAGAGVGIALAGDVVIAGRSARFILSFARLGAVLDAGTSLFLQRSIGAARTRALALLAEPLPAETAEQWGLIWKTVDDAALLDEAIAVAEKLANGPPISLGLIKVSSRPHGRRHLPPRSTAKPRPKAAPSSPTIYAKALPPSWRSGRRDSPDGNVAQGLGSSILIEGSNL